MAISSKLVGVIIDKKTVFKLTVERPLNGTPGQATCRHFAYKPSIPPRDISDCRVTS